MSNPPPPAEQFSVVALDAAFAVTVDEEEIIVGWQEPPIQVDIAAGPPGPPGPAGSGGDLHYTYVQAVASALWTIAHNLGKFPSITVVDTSGNVVEGAPVEIDANNCSIAFNSAFSGTAYLN